MHIFFPVNKMNATKQRLDFWTCFFMDSGEHYVVEKQPLELSPTGAHDNDTGLETLYNLYCNQHGAYLVGSENFYGRATCLVLVSQIFVFGMLGIFTNMLNIILLRKSFKGRESFKEALILLSWIELVLSVSSMGLAYFTIVILENWGRSLLTMQSFLAFRHITTFTRTMSIYIAFLITFERLVVIAFPLKSKSFMYEKPWKSRVVLTSVLFFCVGINLPTLKCTFMDNKWDSAENLLGENNVNATILESSQEILQFPYLTKYYGIFKMTPFWLKETVLALDYFIPLPLLLLCNCLLYFKINSWTKQRSTLRRGQKQDLSTAKMFSVVVCVLLACHLMSCIVFIVTRVENIIYRELLFLQGVTVVMGTSSNFVVYYWFGLNFRREFWGFVRKIVGTKCNYVNNKYETYGKQIHTHSQSALS